jgi:hypothetical protein
MTFQFGKVTLRPLPFAMIKGQGASGGKKFHCRGPQLMSMRTCIDVHENDAVDRPLAGCCQLWVYLNCETIVRCKPSCCLQLDIEHA